MRAASTSSCDSSSCATSSTSTRVAPSAASTSISPAARRTSISAGLETSKLCSISFSSLALGVAGKAFAADMDGPRLGRACDCANEPRVGGDAFAVGGLLDGRLEGFRKAQADTRRELLADVAGALGGRVDEHELGLLAGEPHLDVPEGQL